MATSMTQPVSTHVTVTTPLLDVCPLFYQVPSTTTVTAKDNSWTGRRNRESPPSSEVI
ncbi:hypothetical protein J6590_087168 [Homalodisca vitripennis]|nr:hypothetical protein J6590_087168 [Homalodisca vitripennis]